MGKKESFAKALRHTLVGPSRDGMTARSVYHEAIPLRVSSGTRCTPSASQHRGPFSASTAAAPRSGVPRVRLRGRWPSRKLPQASRMTWMTPVGPARRDLRDQRQTTTAETTRPSLRPTRSASPWGPPWSRLRGESPIRCACAAPCVGMRAVRRRPGRARDSAVGTEDWNRLGIEGR